MSIKVKMNKYNAFTCQTYHFVVRQDKSQYTLLRSEFSPPESR